MNLKTRGLIIKTIKLNDNDAIFTILTEDMQKTTAMSKGIRSLKHKDFAALQLFCYSELELESKSAGFYYVSSAQIVSNFFNLRSSVEKLSFATYFVDAAGVCADFTGGDNEYFRFILNTLYFLENADKRERDALTEYKRLKALFEMRSANASGFAPVIGQCAVCGDQKSAPFFDIDSGGTVCNNCKGEMSVAISAESSKIMQYFTYAPMKEAFKLVIKKPWIVDELNLISENYFSAKVEYFFKSLDYLRNTVLNDKKDCE